jgi:hypothetical protein
MPTTRSGSAMADRLAVLPLRAGVDAVTAAMLDEVKPR